MLIGPFNPTFIPGAEYLVAWTIFARNIFPWSRDRIPGTDACHARKRYGLLPSHELLQIPYDSPGLHARSLIGKQRFQYVSVSVTLPTTYPHLPILPAPPKAALDCPSKTGVKTGDMGNRCTETWVTHQLFNIDYRSAGQSVLPFVCRKRPQSSRPAPKDAAPLVDGGKPCQFESGGFEN